MLVGNHPNGLVDPALVFVITDRHVTFLAKEPLFRMPLIGRILSVDTTDMSFRTFNLRKDPQNLVTYENRDRIIIRELEGLCAPGLHD